MIRGIIIGLPFAIALWLGIAAGVSSLWASATRGDLPTIPWSARP